MYGDRFGAVIGLEAAPALTARVLERELFAATRLTRLEPNHGMTEPVPWSDGFSVLLQLRNLSFELWLDGRAVPVEPAERGAISFLDLRTSARGYTLDPFDFLSFYVSRPALDALAEEQGGPPVQEFQVPPGVHVPDPIVSNLGQTLLPALSAPEQASQLFVDHVSLALMSHLAQRYGDVRAQPRPKPGRLAPRLERRVKELLRERLDGDVSLQELARECGLSRSHFARAFKASFGEPVHRWLLAQRIERARELLDSRLSIREITQRLGFADQSHFTRAFRKTTGVTPAEWRRRTASAPLHSD